MPTNPCSQRAFIRAHGRIGSPKRGLKNYTAKSSRFWNRQFNTADRASQITSTQKAPAETISPNTMSMAEPVSRACAVAPQYVESSWHNAAHTIARIVSDRSAAAEHPSVADVVS